MARKMETRLLIVFFIQVIGFQPDLGENLVTRTVVGIATTIPSPNRNFKLGPGYTYATFQIEMAGCSIALGGTW